jgi:hypothetical protein
MLYFSLFLLGLFMLPTLAQSKESIPTIVVPVHASFLEGFAAREIRRYFYLRTGRLLIIRPVQALPRGSVIIVARRNQPIARPFLRSIPVLASQQYAIQSIHGGSICLVIGGDDEGVLYAAYRFVQNLGVGFSLEGDILPDGRLTPLLPKMHDIGKPLFDLRGIQPFHDFPEGPDWWDIEEYRAVIGQLPKMGMNFIGLHTYPEPIAEPAVWIGTPDMLNSDGSPRMAYPASWANTARNEWGYKPQKTSDFSFGTSMLFDRDDYGADVMKGITPQPSSPEDCVKLFDRSGKLLNSAFRYAKLLGVKTCIGTETPIHIPDAIRSALKSEEQNPDDPAVVRNVYEGIFERIQKDCPVDYYWLWTPEGWNWSGVDEAQVKATETDIRTALAAAKAVHASFSLGTCGWVLGPPGDRAAFDKILPADGFLSCINREVGNTPVDPGFAQVKRRRKWAIPWLEDDPGLGGPELWVGRVRQDAFDARQYGCNGLMGIHWRTRDVGPQAMALAQAAWDQRGWKRLAESDGAVGGAIATFPQAQIQGTSHPELYRTVRWGMTGYNFTLPNGKYAVTLRFCEPFYTAPGLRVFDVSIQGKSVLNALDVYARVGLNHALDYHFPDVQVTNGMLRIGFTDISKETCIAAIDVEGANAARKINCGGPAVDGYRADIVSSSRYMPSGSFWLGWSAAQFGRPACYQIAPIFTRIDDHLPRPFEWTDGPGGLNPDARPWKTVSADYAFVDNLASIEPSVRGPLDRDRFHWWLEKFRYLRAAARLRCSWGLLLQRIAEAKHIQESKDRQVFVKDHVLPLLEEVRADISGCYRHLLACVSTTGELGTIANWEQHILPAIKASIDNGLEGVSDGSLKLEPLSKEYQGSLRIITPAVRTELLRDESLDMHVLILSAEPVSSLTMQWRPLGRGAYRSVPAEHIARGVYRVYLSAKQMGSDDMEYRLIAVSGKGSRAEWPAASVQTVVRYSSLKR